MTQELTINQQQKTNSQATLNCSWTELEEVELTKTLAIIINGQKAYGKDANIIDTFDYFKYKLQGKHSVEQVIYAINKYTDTRNDLPTPSDILNLLKPAKPKITEAQFVNAQKTRERNNDWSEFSYEAVLIRDYNKQNNAKQEEFSVENKKIAGILSNSIKRIE